MKQILQDYLDSHSPEELRAELEKGNRPILQKIGNKNRYPLILVGWKMICMFLGYLYQKLINLFKRIKN